VIHSFSSIQRNANPTIQFGSQANRRRCVTTKWDRAGVSLLEVVLAMGIFIGAVAALNQISNNGARAAIESRLMTKAILRCETKLGEVVAAIEPLVDVGETAFEDDPNWTWSLATSDGPHADVLTVTVTVNFNGPSSLSSTTYSISRLIRDPIVFQITEAEVAE
jgi:hypothetical protein